MANEHRVARTEQTQTIEESVPDRILEMAHAQVTTPTLDETPGTADAELPILGWDNTAEVKGGNMTDAGFARLMPGFCFRGYVLEETKVPSQFGQEEPVIVEGKPVTDPETGKPMTRKMQPVLRLKGTARVPVKGAAPNTFGEVMGRMTIPIHERLKAPLAENRREEERMTAAARAKDPRAPSVKIAVEITYRGQEPDRPAKEGEGKGRTGAHIFEVRRIAMVKATP